MEIIVMRRNLNFWEWRITGLSRGDGPQVDSASNGSKFLFTSPTEAFNDAVRYLIELSAL